jgi:hypothetical protein
MRTKSSSQPKVNVITLGCSKNTVDSEVLMAQLKASEFDVHHETKDDDADIVIINTCGFIENAKQEIQKIEHQKNTEIQKIEETNKKEMNEKVQKEKAEMATTTDVEVSKLNSPQTKRIN